MNEKNEDIKKKLDTLIRLTAIQVIEGKDYRDQVSSLYKAGLSSKDIASLTNKSKSNVRATMHYIRKQKG